VRADIQKAIGFDESQVADNLADGYRRAAYVSKMRGENSFADFMAWGALAEVAKKKGSDRVECNPSLTTCSITKIVETNSESVYSAILAVTADTENAGVIHAQIDKGSEDGIVVGSRGNVWSSKSVDNAGHERKIANRGHSEVLAVKPHSAVIRIQVEQPNGDGMIRKQDMVQLRVRAPKLAARSVLWSLAKTDVTLVDSNNKVIVDFDTLYSDETPELDVKLYARMLEEIHREAALQSNHQILKTGVFANQSLRQAMENTKRSDVETFIDYIAKYPGDTFGQRFYVGRIYALWISYMGKQSEESTSSSLRLLH
jgi:hypothetical protein